MIEFAITKARYHALLNRFVPDAGAAPADPSRPSAIVVHYGETCIHLEHLIVDAWEGYRLAVDGDGAKLLEVLLGEQSPDQFRQLPDGLAIPTPRGDRAACNLRQLHSILDRANRAGGELLTLGSDLARITFTCSSGHEILTRFLSPYYLPVPPSSNDYVTLRIVADRDLYAEAQGVWSGFDCQVWENVPGQPRTVSRGDGYRFYAATCGCVLGRFHYPFLRDSAPVIFARGHDDAWIVIHDGSAHGHRAAGRALRAHVAFNAVQRGAFSVHASAFADLNGDVYLICGEKGAGKTTNVIEAVGSLPGARLVSNDRIFLRNDDGVMVYGSPHSIPVRIGSLLVSANMRRHIDDREGTMFGGHERGYDIGVTIREADYGNVRGVAATGEQLFFGPVELANLLDTTVQPSGRLRGVIEIDRQAAPSGWREVPQRDIANILAKHEHPHYENASPYWNDLLNSSSAPMGVSRLALEGIRAWRIAGNADLAEIWRHASEEIAAVAPLAEQACTDYAATAMVRSAP